jgi:hypothetical protein
MSASVHPPYFFVLCVVLVLSKEHRRLVLRRTSCNIVLPMPRFGIRDSLIGIATGYGLDDRGVGVRVPVGSRIFSSPCSPAGSGAHPASSPKGTGGKSAGA